MDDPEAVRAHFAALSPPEDGAPWCFLENAGGSQVPEQVVTRMTSYFRNSYVQLGAKYPASDAADATVASARQLSLAMATSQPDAGFVLLGASSTLLLNGLAALWQQVLKPGDVLLVATAGHEANVGCWVRAAAATGATLVWWHPGGENGEDTAPLDTLRALLEEHAGHVRLVALPQVSNLLGGVADVAGVCALAHAHGARVVVDSVAYAPHRRVDAAAWGADWVVWSSYKVYGPHAAVLFGTHHAWIQLRAAGAVPPNHFFIVESGYGVGSPAPAYPYEPGGPSHEACAALCGVRDYLGALAGEDNISGNSLEEECRLVTAAFASIEKLEMPVLELLSSYLNAAHDAGKIRLFGPRAASSRVPTFSFLPLRAGLTPTALVSKCHAARVAVRNGHMYAHRLCTHLNIEHGEGVVRVSAVHYNTLAEAQRFIDVLAAEL